MTRADRSLRREVRNPVLGLPAVAALRRLDPQARSALAALLADLATDARARAQVSWTQNKGVMAAYWKAVGAYATHIRRALDVAPWNRRRGLRAPARDVVRAPPAGEGLEDLGRFGPE